MEFARGAGNAQALNRRTTSERISTAYSRIHIKRPATHSADCGMIAACFPTRAARRRALFDIVNVVAPDAAACCSATQTRRRQDQATQTGRRQDQATQTGRRQDQATQTGRRQDQATQTQRRQDQATQTQHRQDQTTQTRHGQKKGIHAAAAYLSGPICGEMHGSACAEASATFTQPLQDKGHRFAPRTEKNGFMVKSLMSQHARRIERNR